MGPFHLSMVTDWVFSLVTQIFFEKGVQSSLIMRRFSGASSSQQPFYKTLTYKDYKMVIYLKLVNILIASSENFLSTFQRAKFQNLKHERQQLLLSLILKTVKH